MPDPLVSVLIPSFNHASYIENAVRSVLSQTYANVELIVNDDGSTDGSHDVLRPLQKERRVKVILNKENRGQSTVLNEAIDLAQGDFISLLPSDDWYLPEKTRLQVEKFRESSSSVGVIYGAGLRYFEDTGKTLPVTIQKYRGRILQQLITEPFCVYPASPMFRRQCFDCMRFDESYTAEGEALYVKLAIYFEFDYVDEPVVVMRDHSENTGKKTDLMYAENLRFWTEFFQRSDLPDDVRHLRPRRLGTLHRCKGLELLVNRCLPDARRALFSAIRCNLPFVLDRRVLGGLALTVLPTPVTRRLLDYHSNRRVRQAVNCET